MIIEKVSSLYGTEAVSTKPSVGNLCAGCRITISREVLCYHALQSTYLQIGVSPLMQLILPWKQMYHIFYAD